MTIYTESLRNALNASTDDVTRAITLPDSTPQMKRSGLSGKRF